MLTAMIIDDEKMGRVSLREKLQKYCPEVSIVAEASDGYEALNIIKFNTPQILFLDIQMPRMNGFDMLNHIKIKKSHIIFTTAYNQYAIKAIRYAAFDYLLKPIDIEELVMAVQRIVRSTTLQTNEQIDTIQYNAVHNQKLHQRMAIPTAQGLWFYELKDLIHLEADRNYTHLYMMDKPKITASKTLHYFEELLPIELFFRAHHSHIVNLNFIKRYIKGDGGQIELMNGTFVDISRNKKNEFLEKIGQIIGLL